MKALSEIRHTSVVPAIALFAKIRHPPSYFRRNVPKNEVLSHPPGFLFAFLHAICLHIEYKNTLESP